MSPAPVRLMRFPSAVRHQPSIDAWLDAHPPALALIARRWFEALRACGPEVCELLHDGHPTACIGDAAFAEVNVFTSHVNIGFFLGTSLPDPAGLLEGSGRFMRHVKLRSGHAVDEDALLRLIHEAFQDMHRRVS